MCTNEGRRSKRGGEIRRRAKRRKRVEGERERGRGYSRDFQLELLSIGSAIFVNSAEPALTTSSVFLTLSLGAVLQVLVLGALLRSQPLRGLHFPHSYSLLSPFY